MKYDQSVVKGDINSIGDIDSLEAEYVDNQGAEYDEEKAASVAQKFTDFEEVKE